MRVEFESIGPEDGRRRGFAVRRIRQTMRWLRSHVGRVKLRLQDVRGAVRGVDKRCDLRAELPGGRAARIEATARNFNEALELAVARLRQQVLRELRRSTAVR